MLSRLGAHRGAAQRWHRGSLVPGDMRAQCCRDPRALGCKLLETIIIRLLQLLIYLLPSRCTSMEAKPRGRAWLSRAAGGGGAVGFYGNHPIFLAKRNLAAAAGSETSQYFCSGFCPPEHGCFPSWPCWEHPGPAAGDRSRSGASGAPEHGAVPHSPGLQQGPPGAGCACSCRGAAPATGCVGVSREPEHRCGLPPATAAGMGDGARVQEGA